RRGGVDLGQEPAVEVAAPQALVRAQALGDGEHVALEVAEQDVLPAGEQLADAADRALEERGPCGERKQRGYVVRPDGPHAVGRLLELGDLQRVDRAGMARRGRQLDAL